MANPTPWAPSSRDRPHRATHALDQIAPSAVHA